MSHVRSQIRTEVKSILETAMVGFTVYRGRKYKLNASELPVIDMRFTNENSGLQVMRGPLERDASLLIRVTMTGVEDDLDDILDDAAAQVEAAMGDDRSINGLAKYSTLVQTNFTDNADGDKALGDVVLRYDIGYRTAIDNAEIAED